MGNLDLDDAIESEIAADLRDEQEDEPKQKVEKTEEDKPEATDEKPETDEELEDEPTSEDGDDDPEEDTDDAENTDVADPDVVLDAPARWDADGKALFEKFDDVTKEYILTREKASQAEITRRQMETADLRKQVEAETTNQNTELTQVLAQARTQFASKYDGLTTQVLAEYSAISPENAAEVAQIRLEMEAESQTLNDLEIQNKKVEVAAYSEFVEEQAKLLPTLAPELVDPVKGEARKAEVAKYLQTAGVSADALNNISAQELAISHKAMKYDALMAQQKTAKPAAPKQGKAVKVAPVRAVANNAKSNLARMKKASDGSLEAETAIMLFEDEHFGT